MITIKQIQNFLVLAEVLHFARAAAQLGISQATLSCEIKKMEKNLDVQLFDRSDKWEIRLTCAGRTYYEYVKNIPADIFTARQEALKSARGERGSLAVAVSNVAYAYIDFGKVCQRMLLRYPEIKLKILDMPHGRDRFDCLKHGKADVAIFAGSSNVQLPEGFAVKNLLTLDMALAIPRKSRLAKISQLQIKDLKNIHFILPPPEEAPNLRRALDEVFMEHCQSLPVVSQEVIGIRGTLQFVAAGMGVGFLFMHKHNPLPDEVVLRKFPVKMERSLLAGCRENNNSPVVCNFLETVRQNIPAN
ncbi:MAG: LysR family transcriptional regulator [Lentisphaerae bacterium]|nr:LysR family transcriptional regulator [Lentisphaerota bacterium]